MDPLVKIVHERREVGGRPVQVLELSGEERMPRFGLFRLAHQRLIHVAYRGQLAAKPEHPLLRIRRIPFFGVRALDGLELAYVASDLLRLVPDVFEAQVEPLFLEETLVLFALQAADLVFLLLENGQHLAQKRVHVLGILYELLPFATERIEFSVGR